MTLLMSMRAPSMITDIRFQIEREINIHIGVAHENIIQLFAAFEDEKNIYMIQELATGGDLFHKIQLEGVVAFWR